MKLNSRIRLGYITFIYISNFHINYNLFHGTILNRENHFEMLYIKTESLKCFTLQYIEKMKMFHFFWGGTFDCYFYFTLNEIKVFLKNYIFRITNSLSTFFVISYLKGFAEKDYFHSTINLENVKISTVCDEIF